MSASGCPRCGGVVALHEGRPSVTTGGHVELWHRACWEVRDVPLVVERAPSIASNARPARRSPAARLGPFAAAAAALAAAAGSTAIARPGLVVASPSLALDGREPLAVHSAMPSRDDAAPSESRWFKPVTEADEIPLVNGVPLDETFPSLRNWVHPVTASAEYMPTSSPRLFGAERIGIERAECGAGHCGVDLDGPRGRPVVAVAAGILIRVERSELGADGRSGRYVRIQHEDGTLTAYMHMDDVSAELREGMAVARGQYVGTLGATATFSSPPHLHFSLEVPNSTKGVGRDDYTSTHYVNPAPFLMRATIAPVIERRAPMALN